MGIKLLRCACALMLASRVMRHATCDMSVSRKNIFIELSNHTTNT